MGWRFSSKFHCTSIYNYINIFVYHIIYCRQTTLLDPKLNCILMYSTENTFLPSLLGPIKFPHNIILVAMVKRKILAASNHLIYSMRHTRDTISDKTYFR